mgnify:FL=1
MAERTTITAPEIIQLLDDANIKQSTGRIEITFNDFTVKLKQRDTVGNSLQEWLAMFLGSQNIYYRPNIGQTFPDFYLSESNETGLCGMKSFYDSANFDVANYRSYINSIVEKPYRLNSDYLIFKYNMDDEGNIQIHRLLVQKVWEITGRAENYALKCQRKRGQIVNIRPIAWYSQRTKFPAFESLPHLLQALYQTQLTILNNTREANDWLQSVISGYNDFFGETLTIQQIKNL